MNLDKLTYAGNLENLRISEEDARYKFVHGDICDAALVADVGGASTASHGAFCGGEPC